MAADLVPLSIEGPAVGSLEQAIVLNLQVENDGQSDSGSYTIQYRVSLDETLDGQDRVIGSEIRPPLEAGSKDRWEVGLPLPDKLPPGKYYVGATVDHVGSIVEANEANNNVVSTETVDLLKGIPLRDCDTFGPAGTAYEVGVNCRVTSPDGYPRSYIVYVPEGVPDSGDLVPTISMIHGSSGQGSRFLNHSGWKEKADEVGLIAIFPTSVMYCEVGTPCENGRLSGWTTKWHQSGFEDNPQFNFEFKPPHYPEQAAWPADDLGFIESMWDDIGELLPVDPQRNFVSGFSNGGGFARQLSYNFAEHVTAVGYAGGFGTAAQANVPEVAPPMYVVLGTKDPKMLDILRLPPNGEIPLDPQQLLAIPELVEFIETTLQELQLEYDSANLRPNEIRRDAISTRFTWNRPLDGQDSATVFHLSFWKDLVHQYPYQQSADKNPFGFAAADTFWEFFDRVGANSTASADLVPIQVGVPGLGSLDESFVVESTIQNLGAAADAFKVQYRLSLDSTIDATDRVLFTADRGPLGSNEIDRWEQRIPVVDGLPQGDFFVGMTVDFAEEIPESNELNNAMVSSDTLTLLKGLPLSQCDSFGGIGTAYVTGVNCRTVEIDDYTRVFLTYVPELETLDEVPLVQMMHGSSGNGGQFLNISGWREKADEQNFVAVFPTSLMYCKLGWSCENGRLNGWETKWNHGDFVENPSFNLNVEPPDYSLDAPLPANDFEFVDAYLDDVQAGLPIDSLRVFASGFSNGAQMTRDLGFLSDRFAATAWVGSGLFSPEFEAPNLIPMYTVLGTHDPKMIGLLGLNHGDVIPLDPVELFKIDKFAESMALTLDALELDYDPNHLWPDEIHQDEVSTKLTWNQPAEGNEAGNSYHVSIWMDLIHHYPYRQTPDKNPNGFVAVDTFWSFFESAAEEHSEPALDDRIPGDANLDGKVTFVDLLRVSANYGKVDATWEDGDFDKDGKITFGDFLLLSHNFG